MKKAISFLLALIMCATIVPFAEATDVSDIPIVDDTMDYSNVGAPTYTYEDGIIIQSYAVTGEEILLGDMLGRPHTHPSGLARHINAIQHSHSLSNIVTQTPTSWSWWPTQAWTANSIYDQNGDWPTVAWSVGQSTTAATKTSLTVGVTDGTVTTTLGGDYTKSHTISTSTTRTFKVPYQKDGRVKVTFNRPYRTFTCVTTYVLSTYPVYQTTQETGSGSAQGAPYNIVVDIEIRNHVY